MWRMLRFLPIKYITSSPTLVWSPVYAYVTIHLPVATFSTGKSARLGPSCSSWVRAGAVLFQLGLGWGRPVPAARVVCSRVFHILVGGCRPTPAPDPACWTFGGTDRNP